MNPEFRSAVAALVLSLTASLLSACGGGGGSDSTSNTGSTAQTLSFPMLSALQTDTANGSTVNYTVSGSCSGTATVIDAKPVAATFEGAPALAVQSTLTINVTNCTPASTASTTIEYFDANYLPLGDAEAGVDYGVYDAPVNVPVNVKVGDSGALGTEKLYTDSTKTTVLGTMSQSYSIQPDTASTAIIDVVARIYDTGNALLMTTESRSRIDATGHDTPVGIDIQYSTNSTTHLVLTPA
jgi:hypothetical protein